MKATIRPGNIEGNLRIPSSKSLMQRACAAALLQKGETIIRYPGKSQDELAALQMIQQLGARILSDSDNELKIISSGTVTPEAVINCGESGLACRLFTPIVAISERKVRITGTGSLLNRPMDEFAQILPAMGVSLSGFTGRLPFTVQGPLKPGPLEIDGSTSSQFLTGLLFAFAASTKEAISIKVHNLVSKPYIDLTLQVLKHFKYDVEHKNYEQFQIKASRHFNIESVVFEVESDWSSAASFLVAAAIGGSVRLSGLSVDSMQSDRIISKLLEEAGASVTFLQDGDILVTGGDLKAFDFDATHAPDLVPVLATLAAFCEGRSTIRGMSRLLHKESNRLVSVKAMLASFGVEHYSEEDTLVIEGGQMVQPAVVDSFNDHRIVMAASIMSLRSEASVVITGAEAVNKSYPEFFLHLQHLGAEVVFGD